MNGHDHRRPLRDDIDRGRSGEDIGDPDSVRLETDRAFRGPRMRVSLALVAATILFVVLLLLLVFELAGTRGGPSQPPPSRTASIQR